MPEQELLVRIVGDDRSLQQAFKRSSRGAEQFETRSQSIGRNLSRGFAAAGISLGAAAGLQIVKSSIDAASDLNEQISRTEVILGDSAQATIDWSETTARSMGISQRAALAATSTFAGLFQTVGVDQARAGALSQTLVKLAADLASLQNSSPEEALVALRSGLAGEAEPLRRFNIFLTEARVQEEALAETGKRTTSSLTAQEKTLARYNLILKDSVKAQGNFELTSGGLANQQRILAAQVDDLSTTLGSVLLPTLTGTVTGLNDAAEAADKLLGAVEDLQALGGIEIPISMPVSILFKGRSITGIGGLASTLAGEVEKGLRSGFTAGISPFQNLFDLITGQGGQGWTFFPSPVDSGSPLPGGKKTPGETAAEAAVDAQDAIAKATARANVTLTQQIRNVATRIAPLKDLIREDPTNARLQQRLTAEIKTQNSLLAQQKSLNESNARAAQTAAAAAHAASVQAAEDRRQAARDAADRRRTQIQAKQFEAIGLTATGEERVPGIGALRRRGRSLLEQIQGTGLDTTRNRNRIGAVLSKQFKDAGREVRSAILAMFNEISAALEQGQKSTQRQQTKFRVTNTSEILGGLGLSEEETQRLRRRLSRLGPGGTIPSPGGAGGAFGFDVGSGGNTIVTGPVTVVSNDPDDFGRKLEKKRRRTGLNRTGNASGTRR